IALDLEPRAGQLSLPRGNRGLELAQPLSGSPAGQGLGLRALLRGGEAPLQRQQSRTLIIVSGSQFGELRFERAAPLLVFASLGCALNDFRVMQMPRLVTLLDHTLKPLVTRSELGIELIGPSLLLSRLEPGSRELGIQVPKGALVDGAVRLPTLQAFEAVRELILKGFDLCGKPLAGAGLVLDHAHQFGLIVVVRLDGALGTALARFAVEKAGLELEQLVGRALLVRDQSLVLALQRLKLSGALLEELSRGCQRRVVLCFGGARVGQLLCEPGGLCPSRIQLGGEEPCRLALAVQRIGQRLLAAVQCLEIGGPLGELATQLAGARHRRDALALCEAQRIVVSTHLLGLLRDPVLDRQHVVGVGHGGRGFGHDAVGSRGSGRREIGLRSGGPGFGRFSRLPGTNLRLVCSSIQNGILIGCIEVDRWPCRRIRDVHIFLLRQTAAGAGARRRSPASSATAIPFGRSLKRNLTRNALVPGLSLESQANSAAAGDSRWIGSS